MTYDADRFRLAVHLLAGHRAHQERKEGGGSVPGQPQRDPSTQRKVLLRFRKTHFRFDLQQQDVLQQPDGARIRRR